MRPAGGRRCAWALLSILLMASAPAEATPSTVGDARLEPRSFADLESWSEDDHAAAFRTFLKSCQPITALRPALRPGLDNPDLIPICASAMELGAAVSRSEARRFFETHFEPYAVLPPSGRGFLTGYYEPEFEGALRPDQTYATPLLDRPDDLVTIPQGGTLPGIEPGYQAARRTASGGYEPYPDRAAIESGALGDRAKPIAYLREPGEAFILHVQGSGRIRLRDGSVMRVAYAGRNGHPYTSIGRLLVQRGVMDLETMTLEKLLAWLRDNPTPARALMRENRSYIFFRPNMDLKPEDGPVGGEGIPLTPGRSLAVDRTLWSYGLPFWLNGELPAPPSGSVRLRRLMIAQDTGSAILGPARGDFFAGSGPEAGTVAGLMRHPTDFVVLRPKPRS
jgi:membrane-bound lytic murein transglycosylase A